VTTQRDELAELIRYARGWDASVRPSQEDRDIVATIIAVGYCKPRTVTTVDELDALPVRSVVLDCDADAWQKVTQSGVGIWELVGVEQGLGLDASLPAAVLYSPETTL
jgi:hypothetical protein